MRRLYVFGRGLAIAALVSLIGAAAIWGMEDSNGSMAGMIKIGKPAPDIDLDGVVGTVPGKEFQRINLKDLRGRWVVLLFYPADFTVVCPTEIKGFNESLDVFNKLDATVLGISTDSKWSHLAWIKRGDLGELKYPLLADFNKRVSRVYGVLDDEAGVAYRALFLIDPNGVLQYQVVHNLDVGRNVEETLRVLEALQSGGLCPLGWKPGQKTLQQKNNPVVP